MNELQSNARRAFLRPANQRESPHTRSRIIGAILPVTIASTCSATAQCCRMRGATSRPESWAGTTCGVYSPKEARRTNLQGGFRKEVGRKNVTFGHYIPIQYIIRKYALSTIYCYCSRMGGGKLQLLYLRVAGHNLRTWPMHRGLFLLFSPRPFFFMNWLR